MPDARPHSHDPQVARLVRVQRSGALQPVARGIGGLDDLDEPVEIRRKARDPLQCIVKLNARPGPPDSAGADRGTQQAAAGQRLVDAHHLFAQARSVRIGDHEADVRGDGSDIGGVVVDAFQLEQNRAHPGSGLRKLHAADPLHRLAKGRAVRNAGVAGDAFGQRNRVRHRQVLESFFDALVHVEHAQLKVQNRLARHGEAEVSRFDDAGVYRPHRNLKDALPQGRPVDMRFTFERRQRGIDGKTLAQRMNVRPVVVQRDAAWIGMARGFDAEPVLDLAFLPVERRNLGRHRGEGAMLRVNRGAQQQIARVRAVLEDVVEVVALLLRHPVLGKHRDVAAARQAQRGRGFADLRGGHLQVNLRRAGLPWPRAGRAGGFQNLLPAHGYTTGAAVRMRAAPTTSESIGPGSQKPNTRTSNDSPITG